MAISLNSLERLLQGFKERIFENIPSSELSYYIQELKESDFEEYKDSVEDSFNLYKTIVTHNLNSTDILISVNNENKQEVFCSKKQISKNEIEIVSDSPINGTVIILKIADKSK